jgi:uncharacterized protein YjbI with pentapeptide repeats
MVDPALAPAAPRLPAQPAVERIGSLEHDTVLAEIELAGLTLSNQHARGVRLEGACLIDCDLSCSQLDSLRLLDCSLRRCNLANVAARDADATRLEVCDSRLTGLSLREAKLLDVTVRESRVDLSSFAFAQLSRVTFEDCRLVESSFLEAQLDSVRFHRCDLTAADFRGASLERCEFRRSRLSAVQGLASLRGAAMERPDVVELAGELASALGIDTLEDGPDDAA